MYGRCRLGLQRKTKNTYARIVPDFVIEVRSPSDELAAQQDKIKNVWLANGVRLAWLFDPAEATAYISQRWQR
ncbi:MAG: Uma2 family endonuclease [Lewinellaceae bacterium]|nr:Uma2 family endonuclease [Lewinellaceae bacterium]